LEYQQAGKHLEEIKTFIFSQNIDISLISETHFTNKNYFRIPGNILHHTIHFDGKGGTALIIRSYYEIDKYQKEYLQTISIAIEN